MVLQVFVTPDCSACEEAARLMALARRELHGLVVELQILTPGGPVPSGVVATPAYLLDGRPISVDGGAPAVVAELDRRLRQRD